MEVSDGKTLQKALDMYGCEFEPSVPHFIAFRVCEYRC